jgi:uncharacterized glyoxalase superfamily protein PhnB
VDDPFRRPALTAGVFYQDPWAALDGLEQAFGFERRMVITDKDGKLGHSEMGFGGSLVYVGAEWAEFVASPASVGGKNTQTIHAPLEDGIDAHCAPARAAGAVILQEPTDQFYGDRTYRGARSVRHVSRTDAEKASGLTIDADTWP